MQKMEQIKPGPCVGRCPSRAGAPTTNDLDRCGVVTTSVAAAVVHGGHCFFFDSFPVGFGGLMIHAEENTASGTAASEKSRRL